ncbi:MAG: DUF2243 domain-containing protein [Thermoleophilia bacterium]|nr:DUF2243 domain-containing protein [Thermoleophilia bacterium]MDQ3858071.1 DUF2243 domain-containing protein [Actinomycetota bacterium]
MQWTRERFGYAVVGLAVGGLADGFVLHQLLQWHHLWSRRTSDATVSGLEDNTFADGVFHTATLVVLVGGIALLVGRRVEARPLVGLALVGWGTFHVVDQLLFHLALGVHHIREHVADRELYDWAFFTIGLALIVVGASIARIRPSAAQLAGDRL